MFHSANVFLVLYSPPFWSMFLAWVVSQTIKMSCALIETKRLDFRYMVSTGGMPSAHSAMVSALAMSVGLLNDFNSPAFVVAMGLALVVMFDASTVRRAAGMQARLLNEIIDELFRDHHLSERKLVELLGHTRLEVFMGMVVGLEVAVLVTSVAQILWPTTP
jgi:acid phosphatase family membrane protein YuiD